jgi:hypothetical protein
MISASELAAVDGSGARDGSGSKGHLYPMNLRGCGQHHPWIRCTSGEIGHERMGTVLQHDQLDAGAPQQFL